MAGTLIDVIITLEVEVEEKVALAEEKKAEPEAEMTDHQAEVLIDHLSEEALTNLHQEEAVVQIFQNQNVREEASFQQGSFEPILV